MNIAPDATSAPGGPTANRARTLQKRTREAQDRFLEAFARDGTVLRASKATGVGRTTVYDWERGDVQGFRHRYENARHAFRESLEAHALDIAQQLGPTNSPLLLITLLNANWPEKYRQNVVVTDDTAKDVLKELKLATRPRKARRKAGDPSDAEAVRTVEELLAPTRARRERSES